MFDVLIKVEVGTKGNFLFQNGLHTPYLMDLVYNSYNPGQMDLKS